MNHQQILIRAIKESGLTARDIADGTGVSESSLSRFVNGKQDLKAGDYFAVLNFLPDSAKSFARSRLGMDDTTSLKTLVMQASNEEKAEVLFAIANLLLEDRKSVDSVEFLPAV
ncbi:MAG: helix-turn-helix transcriptional regulator [Fischerella sp.]|uniref:helix-turn-helix domain-containing protein n=1 Tax=Fischerella sp. TaxID=1191 RepID=UPI001792A605|nr:helix-turn-helix transcriptional regulator [Fischerella sp.]NWF61591.1 helix-turn-helix transcriptional regulator [Fischerella sp.]